MFSYADFITLLFAFFVVMFATSQEPDSKKVKQFEDSIQGRHGELFEPLQRRHPVHPGWSAHSEWRPPRDRGCERRPPADSGPIEGEAPADSENEFPANTEKEPSDSAVPGVDSTPTPSPTQAPGATASPTATPGGEGFAADSPQMKTMYQDLKTLLISELKENKIEIRQEKRGIVISLSEAGFFDSGSASLKSKSLETINRIGKQILAIKTSFAIRIEGHTDDIPLAPSSPFRDNLGLSTERATTVIRHMVHDLGFPQNELIASGYGEWCPVSSNETPSGRARNRRVDIVILNQEFSGIEPHKRIASDAR